MSDEANEREEVNPEVRQAPEGLSRFIVWVSLVCTVTFSILLCVGAYLLLEGEERVLGRRADGAALGVPHPVAAVHEALFRTARAAPSLARRQRARLERYEWVDRDAGVVAIPVDRAIDLYLARRSAR